MLPPNLDLPEMVSGLYLFEANAVNVNKCQCNIDRKYNNNKL